MKNNKWLILPLVLVLIAITGYSYKALSYQQSFVKNTQIGSVDVSNLNKEEAKQKLSKELTSESVDIVDNGVLWKSVPKEQLGIEYDVDSAVDTALSKQNPWLWGVASFSKPASTEVKTTQLDKDEMKKTTDSLKKELVALNKDRDETKNASIEHKDGKFEIVDEVQGNTINEDELLQAFFDSISTGKPSVEINDYLTKPTILASDDSLQEELDAIYSVASINASYSINGQDIQIPQDTIASWVTLTDGQVDLDSEKVANYVASLGEDYNTSTNPTNFKSTKRGEVSVPAGAYSWTIATNSEAEQLKKLILAGEDFSGRVPYFEGSTTPGGPLITDTYIEVDLENQHMWYYKNGKVELETAVITGKPSTPTPPGMFYVWNKKRDEILRGEDYASPVDYWMPIDWTGVGIHDSPWQNADAYGGDSHLTVGSHGCINTPPEICKQLFNMIDVGVPVVVF